MKPGRHRERRCKPRASPVCAAGYGGTLRSQGVGGLARGSVVPLGPTSTMWPDLSRLRPLRVLDDSPGEARPGDLTRTPRPGSRAGPAPRNWPDGRRGSRSNAFPRRPPRRRAVSCRQRPGRPSHKIQRPPKLDPACSRKGVILVLAGGTRFRDHGRARSRAVVSPKRPGDRIAQARGGRNFPPFLRRRRAFRKETKKTTC